MSETTTSTGRPPSCAASAWATSSSRKSPSMKITPSMGSMGNMSMRDNAAIQRTDGCAAGRQSGGAGTGSRRLGAEPRSTTTWPGLQQTQGFVDFFELEGGARTVAVALGQLDVRVVDVVVQPGLVDLLALGADFHGPPIIGI
jgi:hypothetical protein